MSKPATVTVTITGSGDTAPPTVVNPGYTAVGNTPLGVGTTPAGPAAIVSGSVLTGDTDPGGTLSVTANTTPVHGTVTMNPDGAFTYTPNPGYSGTDSFQVTIAGSADPSLTATATVTITVGTLVWYVDNSQGAAGDGTAGSPFSTLTAANAAAGAGSVIFLYQGDASYMGGAVMQPGEDLFGQPHGLTVGAYPLVPAGGSAPAIINEGGDGIDLAEGADVEGVSVAYASGNGIAAGYVNDATVGATTPVAVFGAGGAGILISHGDGTMNFGATSVTGSAGDAVDVNNRGGGSVTFGGPISGTGGGVYLDGNAFAVIGFTGTLTLDPATGGAFYASGGVVTATGAGSTLGGALVDDSVIGPAGLTFQSVSYSGTGTGIQAAGGADNGRLTITGTGTLGSGGTIQGSPAVRLGTAYEPSFTDMVIEGTDGDGITGMETDGLTLDDCEVSGDRNPADTYVASDDGLNFSGGEAGEPDGLTGTVTINNSTITSYAEDDAVIYDTSGTLNLTVSGSTFGGEGGGGAASEVGLVIAADGTAVTPRAAPWTRAPRTRPSTSPGRSSPTPAARSCSAPTPPRRAPTASRSSATAAVTVWTSPQTATPRSARRSQETTSAAPASRPPRRARRPSICPVTPARPVTRALSRASCGWTTPAKTARLPSPQRSAGPEGDSRAAARAANARKHRDVVDPA